MMYISSREIRAILAAMQDKGKFDIQADSKEARDLAFEMSKYNEQVLDDIINIMYRGQIFGVNKFIAPAVNKILKYARRVVDFKNKYSEKDLYSVIRQLHYFRDRLKRNNDKIRNDRMRQSVNSFIDRIMRESESIQKEYMGDSRYNEKRSRENKEKRIYGYAIGPHAVRHWNEYFNEDLNKDQLFQVLDDVYNIKDKVPKSFVNTKVDIGGGRYAIFVDQTIITFHKSYEARDREKEQERKEQNQNKEEQGGEGNRQANSYKNMIIKRAKEIISKK